MFDDAWRCMKYRFYDPKLHGTDWDAMRSKYKPLVAYVADRQELMNIINEMIGELNASHTGASAAKSAGLWAVAVPNSSTAHHDFSPADLRVKSLAEIKLPELLARFNGSDR